MGAGAIGGFLAARLALDGQRVSVLARGATLEAIRRHGLRLRSGERDFTAQVAASADAGELGPQDVVIIAVKAQSLGEVAGRIAALTSPATTIVPVLNGIPWWFFKLGAQRLNGYRIRAVDRDGAIERSIPSAQLLGAVAFPSISCPAPGHVVHASGERFIFGEPTGGVTGRVEDFVGMLKRCGLAAEASADIRTEIWLKLLGNACFNPVSLLTGSPTDKMIDDPLVNRLFAGLMNELLELGRRLDIQVDIRPEQRLAMTRKLGNIKTSMLQDVEAGRPVEIDGILGSAVEIAEQTELQAPLLACVYALARARSRILGLYGA